MTTILLGRKDSTEPLRFEFESDIMGFAFYVEAKDHYAEDDLVVQMEEEVKKGEYDV